MKLVRLVAAESNEEIWINPEIVALVEEKPVKSYVYRDGESRLEKFPCGVLVHFTREFVSAKGKKFNTFYSVHSMENLIKQLAGNQESKN